MNLLSRILQKIVSVYSWDGSASNYSTAEAYAKASLINFNSGDPENWTKSLVKLPVRREGDSNDTYVKEAVYAASGGRGITQVSKPDTVEDSEFERQLKNAANEIIKAYLEMDEVAPESVYEIAGKEYPMENQAMAFSELYHEINEAIWLIDHALGTYSWVVDVYLSDDKNIFAVVSQNGKLFKQHFMFDGDDLIIGDSEEILLEPEMPMMTQTKVFQQKDGLYRWLCIAATTALNRNAELNSKQLYDSFIEHINETGEYPILNFYHQPNTRLGQADFAARDDNLYILSGTFDDNEFGKAAAKGLESKPGYWGDSIEFWALEGEWLDIDVENTQVSIPVYTKGINTAVSILPESDARCIGTLHIAQSRGLDSMNDKIKKALIDLYEGNEELANQFEQSADRINQEINENMIHQSVEEVEEVTEEIEEVVEEIEDELEEDEVEGSVVELDETFLPNLLADLEGNEQFEEMVQERINQAIAPLIEQLNSVVTALNVAQNKITALQTTQQETNRIVQENEAEKRQRWENDSPRKTVVSYRPRLQEIEEAEPVVNNGSYADKANNTLNKILGG